MKKRISAFLLSLCLLFSVLPGAAGAAGDAQDSAGGELVLDKWVEDNEDGTFKLVLESYATGSNGTIETKPVPLDIVLVLDESGSMEDTLIDGCADTIGTDIHVTPRGHVVDSTNLNADLDKVLFTGHKVFSDFINQAKTYIVVYPRDGTTRTISYCSECGGWYTNNNNVQHDQHKNLAQWIPFATADETPSEIKTEDEPWQCHVQFYEKCGKDWPGGAVRGREGIFEQPV